MNRRELLRTLAIFSASGTLAAIATPASVMATPVSALPTSALPKIESLAAMVAQSVKAGEAVVQQIQGRSSRPLALVTALQELTSLLQEADVRLAQAAAPLRHSAAFWQACSDALLRTSAELASADTSGVRMSMLQEAQSLFCRTAGLFGEATRVTISQARSGSFC